MVCGDGGGSCGSSLLEAWCAGLIAIKSLTDTHIPTALLHAHPYAIMPAHI
jgi:hypothetical protein